VTPSSQSLPRIALIGGGAHASVVTECIRSSENATVVGYVDLPHHDRTSMAQLDVTYLGTDNDLPELTADGTVTNLILGMAGLDHRELRYTLADKTDRFSPNWWTAIHRSAVIADGVRIAKGAVVFAGAVVNPLARIGRHAVINTGAIIEHHAVVDDFAVISPRATLCGGVQVGRGTFVGAGATIITGVSIGPDAVVGAGTVVLKDVPPGKTVMGNPGRIRESKTGIKYETAIAQ